MLYDFSYLYLLLILPIMWMYDTLGLFILANNEWMNRLAKEGLLRNIDKVELPTCEFCLFGKAMS